jgi:cytochrome c553
MMHCFLKLLVTICTLQISILSAVNGSNFLTLDEYSEMLYNNPKGISCAHCHGNRGEKQRYIRYYNELKGREITITFSPLYKMPYKNFKKALVKNKRFMPRYILAEAEIRSLYYYVLKKNNRYRDKHGGVPKKKSLKNKRTKNQNLNY